MHPALAALHEKVRDRVSADEFQKRVEAARAEFDGLLDDEALGLLVLDELGLNEGAYVTLGDLKGRSEATARVSVVRVEPVRTFEKDGREGRVVNVVVADATGETRLVLWDKDVERADELKPGAHVTVVNARVKEGRLGPELHVGPWSVLEVEGALDPARRKLLADVAEEKTARQTKLDVVDPLPTSLAGALAYVSPTRPYRTPENTTGFVCDVDVETEKGPLRVVAWGEMVRQVRAVPLGTRVRFEGLAPKVKGAQTEWHTGPGTVLSRV